VHRRDSEESAPAEYPPEQPEADVLDDDAAAYGAEEVDLEAALIKELEEVDRQGSGEDQEMEVEAPGGLPAAGDDDSDAGSEDLEAESESSEEELEEDEQGDGDEDVEMADDPETKDETSDAKTDGAAPPSELMVH
jgi:histone chaperone ASF1